MNYIIPVAIVLLCYKSVLGSEELTDNELSDTTNAESLHRVRRAGLSMLRLGRGLQMLRLGKRALPMLRLGRSTGDELSNDYIQYIMSLIRGDRQVPLPRYGKDLALNEMLMEALKNAEMRNTEMPDIDSFGYALDYSPERQIRPAPRPGMRYRRSADASDADLKLSDADSSYDQEPDRKLNVRIAPLMRYGKELNPEYYDIDEGIVKRAMRMLRLGRGMRMLRLGKRPMDSEDVTEEEKRALNLLRLGKRPFRMLRLGRSDNEEEKRAPLHLLRLGKKSDS